MTILGPRRAAMLGTALNKGGGALPSLYMGQVGGRCFIPDTLTTTRTKVMSQTLHPIWDDAEVVEVDFANWMVRAASTTPSGTGQEVGPGAPCDITASIGPTPTGPWTQLLFSGAALGTIPDGGQITGVANYPLRRGAFPYIRHWKSCAAGILTTGTQNTAGLDTANYPASNDAADLTMGGTITRTGGSTAFPLAIRAMTRRPSVLILGTSRAAYVGDSYDSAGEVGEVARSIGASLACINAAIRGDSANYFLANNAKRLALAAHCSHIVCEYGVNDFYNLGRSVAGVKADLEAIIALFPGKPFYQTTITPVVTSTDSYTTLGNQTVVASTTPKRAQLNDFIRAGLTGAAGYFEVADVVENSRNGDKLAVDQVRTVTDAAMTSGSGVLTSTTMNFTTADVGKAIRVAGAGAAGAQLITTIASQASSTSVTLTASASTTVSGTTANLDMPSLDGLHLAIAAALRIKNSGAINTAVITR